MTASPWRCGKCGEEGRDRLDRAPFPNELGARIRGAVCAACWDEWKQRQMLLINHYGLDLRDPKAREFLVTNLRSFLFGEGDGQAEIDTSREGEISW